MTNYSWRDLNNKESLASYERYMIYQTIDDYIDNYYVEDVYGEVESEGYYTINDILLFTNLEIHFELKITGEYNDYDETLDLIYNVEIKEVIKYDLEQLLKDNNINYEVSKVSESIYLKNGAIRLSCHKRPDYEVGYNNYISHEYDKEYIYKNEKDMYFGVKELIQNGTLES